MPEPVGRGRVILQDKAIPIQGDNPAVELVCGSCGAPLLIGLDPITFRFMFGAAEVLVRCNRCKSHNDATPSPPGPCQLDTDLLDHIKSQNDLCVLAKCGHGLVSIVVEGKVAESFGAT